MTVDELETSVDAETTRIALAFETLLATAKARTLTAEEQTKADALIAHLKSIGSDPSNPVPPAPPATGLPATTPVPDPNTDPNTVPNPPL